MPSCVTQPVFIPSLLPSHRLKNSRSSIDAQTISTFDSSGDNSGFYRNYQQAWENLKFTGHSSSYKPSHRMAEVESTFNQRGLVGRNGFNEGLRDTNEITLNADVAALYTRPEGRPTRQKRDPASESHSPWRRGAY